VLNWRRWFLLPAGLHQHTGKIGYNCGSGSVAPQLYFRIGSGGFPTKAKLLCSIGTVFNFNFQGWSWHETAVLLEVGRSGGGWAGSELVLTGSSRLLTCIETQVYININFKCILVQSF
jgi:hypothetical protein